MYVVHCDKQTVLTVCPQCILMESILSEALAIFRGHVLKLVLQVLADCESKSEGKIHQSSKDLLPQRDKCEWK